MNLYLFTAEVPRKYIDVECFSESGYDLVEFWGTVTPATFKEWNVELVEVSDFGILDMVRYDDDQVIALHLGDRKSIIADFEVSIPEDVSEGDAGEWIEDKLPGDWHVDEVIKQEGNNV